MPAALLTALCAGVPSHTGAAFASWGATKSHCITPDQNTLQVRRLKMYNSGKAKRDRSGKVVAQELQSKELPSTRIVPDRRWFGNTRVIGQKQLESFREQMAGKADNPFMVLMKERKLPMQARFQRFLVFGICACGHTVCTHISGRA